MMVSVLPIGGTLALRIAAARCADVPDDRQQQFRRIDSVADGQHAHGRTENLVSVEELHDRERVRRAMPAVHATSPSDVAP